MRENRLYGSEGGEPQLNAAFLPLSWYVCFCRSPKQPWRSSSLVTLPMLWEGLAKRREGEVIVQFGSPSPAYGRPSPREPEGAEEGWLSWTTSRNEVLPDQH